MSSPLGIPDTARQKWAALGHALTNAGTAVPCVGSLDWISERAEIRSEASARCGGCPVLTQCRSYADAAKERFGVWAAIDRTVVKQSGRRKLA